MPRQESADVRFFEKVFQTDSCWLWTGATNNQGYGMFNLGVERDRRLMLAHRYAFQAMKGALVSGLVLDHLCNNPICVNPEHLRQVTQKENMLRGISGERKARTRCPHGHPYDEKNTKLKKDGSRGCKACDNARSFAYRRKKGLVHA